MTTDCDSKIIFKDSDRALFEDFFKSALNGVGMQNSDGQVYIAKISEVHITEVINGVDEIIVSYTHNDPVLDQYQAMVIPKCNLGIFFTEPLIKLLETYL